VAPLAASATKKKEQSFAVFTGRARCQRSPGRATPGEVGRSFAAAGRTARCRRRRFEAWKEVKIEMDGIVREY
jgi:hypothetical protein